MKPTRALVILGTRPEAVKLFPVIGELSKDSRLETVVVVTGQHQEMVDQILGPFGIVPRANLGIMEPNQTLNGIASRVLPRLDALYTDVDPAVVVVQGDTTSAFCAGLAAFHRGIHVAHVEAGLRSYNRAHPFPEESNRRMISAVADLHLAPTSRSAENLLREGVARSEIVVTGNTAVDSLLAVLRDPRLEPARGDAPFTAVGDGRLVLITVHRRESWASRDGAEGELPIHEIFHALAESAAKHPEVDYVYPVHRNPRVREPAARILGRRRNVHILDPLPYVPFVGLMARASVILTDSGGIQEEAPSLGVPVLVVRETTERPEGVECGTNRLVGTKSTGIVEALRQALAQPRAASGDLPLPSPFGDGKAAWRTRQAILHLLGLEERPQEFEGIR